MPQCQVTVDVAAPRDVTFAVFTDLAQAASRISAIERLELLTEGPVGLGTRWRETRTMFGREATEEMEITRFDTPQRYEVDAESHGSRYHTAFAFEEAEVGTRVTMTFAAIPQTLSARVMSRVLAGWMMSTVEKAMRTDMQDLQRVVEGVERGDGGERAARPQPR